MKKWNLSLPDGQEVQVEIKSSAPSIEVLVGDQKFSFTEKELLDWQGESQLIDGQLLVSSRLLQRSFDMKPFVPKSMEEDAGHKQLKSLFPGKVIQVLPKENAWAEAGDLLVVMESMKMEYHYQTPKRIFIEKILIREGEVLGKGKEFFIFHE